jgi:hypothetical protein
VSGAVVLEVPPPHTHIWRARGSGVTKLRMTVNSLIPWRDAIHVGGSPS